MSKVEKPFEVLAMIVDVVSELRKNRGGYVTASSLMSTAVETIRALHAAGLQPVIIGGFAMSFYAEPRATRDFDFTLSAADLKKAKEVLLKAGFTGGEVTDFRDRFLHHFEKAQIQVDLLDFLDRGFQNEIISRATEQDFFGIRVKAISPEDLVLTKLGTNRTKDKNDIESIRESAALDEEYIAHWATRLGLT